MRLTTPRPGSACEVLLAFAGLGMRCFGGPVAHLGYLREEFVERRRWLDEQCFADLVGLCQFLPGPASSQTGFAIGLLRGGMLGGVAAWTGFTLPSAVLLVLFAYGADGIASSPLGAGLLHGLALVAVAIVAQAVWGMARSLCPDRERGAIAMLAAILVLVRPGSAGQVAAIALGAAAGLVLCRRTGAQEAGTVATRLAFPLSRRTGTVCLALFAALLAGLPLLDHLGGWIAMFDGFFRSGALVFGGGHVVLPLLRDAVVTPGWVSQTQFLAGYAAAQAVPGPLFAVAAYLGAVMRQPPTGVAGAAIALVAIFLPGILLLMGTLPFWDALRRQPRMQASMRGVNAAVVGLLAAALYNPVWTQAVLTPGDFAQALFGFVLLVVWRTPSILVVLLGAAAGIVLAAG